MGRLLLCLVFAGLLAGPALAQKHGSVSGASSQSGASRHGRIGSTCVGGAAVSGGWWGGPGYFGGYPVFVLPPIYTGPTIVATPTGFGSQFPITWMGPFPPYAMPVGQGPGGFGGAMFANAPNPNPLPNFPADAPAPVQPNGRRAAERIEELIKLGDRWFRAGEMKRVADRYAEAARVELGAPLPYVRLAQVAIKRGDYVQGARFLREAQTADPDWLDHIPGRDVQNLFGEPADFSAELGRLETHVQAQPEDREAWLLLGTELFLTGRTDRARDIFVRLTDRKPDALLQSLLDACQVEVAER